MKLSHLFTKTSKTIPADETSNNAQYLIRAGFIHKTMAGVYSYLPLGYRVLNKIENILRKYMNKIGGQEVLMPGLSPKDSWELTKRWKEIPEYFCLPTQTGTEYRLNPTHEEVVSPIVQEYISSYRDIPDYKPNEQLPLAIYQIQTKFRDEIRAKAGIMRGREFRMKDMYDFHRTTESQESYFELITSTYHEFFNEIGLKSYAVNASGGVFSEKFSREFQALCPAGEDWVFIDPSDTNSAYNQEVAPCSASVVDYTGEDMLEKQDIYLEDVIGVQALFQKLQIPITKTTKTLFYEDKEGSLVGAVVRGDRSISEEKLQKLYQKPLQLASEETVMKYTNAKIGYAGIINLDPSILMYYDDSIAKLKNFETGTNKTGYHSINVCFGRDVAYPSSFVDIKEAIEGDTNPLTGNIYSVSKGSEIGNIFDLGQKWVKSFNIQYSDENGTTHYPYMGCHGIGTSRCMGVIAEIYSDEKGLKWPKTVSPFTYHLITNINPKDDIMVQEKIKRLAQDIYEIRIHSLVDGEDNKLSIREDDVLWDDRMNISLGEKFKDAELIGCPIHIIITARSIEEQPNGYEIKYR